MTRHAAWVIHAGAIGDFLLTLSVVQGLRRAGYGPVRIVGRSLYGEIAGAAEGVDHLAGIDAAPWHRLFGDAPAEAIEALRAFGPAEVVIDMLGISPAAADGLQASGIEHLVRLDPRPAPGSIEHITRQWQARIRAQGIDVSLQAPAVRVAPARRDDELAVIHVGSGGRQKCWPLDCWIELANRVGDGGRRIALPLGPAELDSPDIAKRRAQLTELGEVVESPSLRELKSLIAAARVYVGNDSGVTHLAAAVSTPTIAVFGATDPRVWRPLGRRCVAVGGLGDWPSVDDVAAVVMPPGETHADE